MDGHATDASVPAGFGSDPDVAAALAAIDGDAVVFVLGRAGTGKTTLVRHLRRHGHETRQVVLAPTGVAALNAGGQTLHSFFRLPPRLLQPRDLEEIRPRKLWREIGRVVIDEISMVRADLLDAVDAVLRRARKDGRPFGGVPLVAVGDFLQLPPVARAAEAEMLRHLGYRSPFAFDAAVLRHCAPRTVRLTTVHRQTDPVFLDLLGRLRDGRDVADALAALNTRCFRPHRAGVEPMLLCGTNARVDRYNAQGLAALDAAPMTYEGKTEGRFEASGDRLPVPQALVLKPGARVMAVKNDPRRRFVNGSLGTVASLEPTSVTVRFDGGHGEAEVERQLWEKIQYRWDAQAKRVEAETVGSYAQIPLVPAWAATIHKAQGLTLDDVRIDLEHGAFASGQAYVALSRARTLEGLSLTRPLRARDVFVAPALAAFERAVG